MGALHNFLRNNFRPGEWLGQYCTSRQHNRLANIALDIQGINCRIHKPVDQEGRGWRVIVDGSSDIQPAPNPPWATTNPKAACVLSGGSATTSTAPVPFSTVAVNTNEDVLLPVGGGPYTAITAVVSGVYEISVEGTYIVYTASGIRYAIIGADNGAGTTYCGCGFQQDDIADVGTGRFDGTTGGHGLFALAGGTTVRVSASVSSGDQMGAIRLSMSLYELP